MEMPEESENFLKDFVELNKGTEIPELFALWCGLSAISGVLGRRIWIDMGTYTVFPNTFIVLVAGSGRCRKSTAIGVAEGLVRSVEPRPNIIAQKITPEALIEALHQVDGTSTTVIREVSEGFVIVDELATFLNKKSYEAGLAALLIPLYDCKSNFEYHTKGQGRAMLSNCCLGLLGASTIDWLRHAVPAEAVGAGLTSRIIFVFVEAPMPPVAITTFSPEKKAIQERLIRSLSKAATYQGQMTLSKDAWKYYEERYNEFWQKSDFFNNHLLTGYASRRFVHLLKVGMLFAVSTNSPEIEERHLIGADSILTASEEHMPRLLELVTSSDQGALLNVVRDKIFKAEQISRSDLLRLLSNRIDSRGLTDIIDTLIHSNQVRAFSNGSAIYYARIKQ
jgi:hypothetical protein